MFRHVEMLHDTQEVLYFTLKLLSYFDWLQILYKCKRCTEVICYKANSLEMFGLFSIIFEKVSAQP